MTRIRFGLSVTGPCSQSREHPHKSVRTLTGRVRNPMRYSAIVVSVVIPAHNEASVVGRLLSGLLAGAAPGEFEIWVVANGCTDDTAEIAGAFADVKVLITPQANKHAAMRLADEHAEGFPRLYVDADVELGSEDVR